MGRLKWRATSLVASLSFFFLHLVSVSVSGRKKVFSFGIVAENFEVFEDDIFYCKVLRMVGEGQWYSVGFFVL